MRDNSFRSTPHDKEVVKNSPFSKELIQETIKVFQEENGIVLSEEEAVEALGSFANLFLAFSPSHTHRDQFSLGLSQKKTGASVVKNPLL